MELKLNIYEKKEIVKTYETDAYDLEFGTVEDFAELINLDELESGSDVEIIKLAGAVCFNGMDNVKMLLKDVFDGLTDEELKHTKVKEIASVLVAIVKYTIEELGKGAKGKN